MRFIKLIIISIIFLSIFLTAFSFLFPPHLHIARNVEIFSTRQKIRATVMDLHTWKVWNKFIEDSALTNLMISPDGNRLNSDQLELSLKSDSFGIESTWSPTGKNSFTGGFKLMELTPGRITVQEYFDFTFKWYPWEKFSSLVYDKQLQPILEESLHNLKLLVENNP
jgi:hypothetical protein